MRPSKLRLLRLREITEAKGEEMKLEAKRFGSMKRPEAVSAFNLFQTPAPLASQMAEVVFNDPKYDQATSTILEPSAGLGRLYRPLREQHQGHITLVEQSTDCCRVLYEQEVQAELIQQDFLTYCPEVLYDYVVMNPPFKRGTDIRHVDHALTLLKAGGLLVGLCYNGVKQNRNLKPRVDTWEVLPDKTFHVSVAMFTIHKT